MARNRATPSFSVEIRNGRQRSPLKRGWAEGALRGLTKRVHSGNAEPPLALHETTAHAALKSAVDTLPEMAADASVRPTIRVLPDLSLSSREANSSFEQPDLDVSVKPKRTYRRKEQPVKHLLRPTVLDAASPPPNIDDSDDLFAPSDLSSPVTVDPVAEPGVAPAASLVEMRRGRETAGKDLLRRGERWKRRLSKYSR